MINQIIINIIVSSSLYLLIAYSFSIIYNITKFFHIAHAVIITIGAYLTFLFFNQLSLPIWLAIVFSIFISIILGAFMETGLYKPLRKKKTSDLSLLIASLGLYIVLQNIISLFWGDDAKKIRIGDVQTGHYLFGGYITSVQLNIIFFSILLVISGLLFLKYSKYGKNIRAVSSNIELSNIMGINSSRYILLSFCIGSGYAAVSGILVGYNTGISPTMGFNLLLYGVVVMIIGGVGSIWGLIGGALMLSISQHLTAFYIDSKWMDTITYVILILFLIWKPLGFSGKRIKKTEI